jgi:transposase InsO family protein
MLNLCRISALKASRNYYVFDLLYWKGRDLTRLPLIERRALLKSFVVVQDNRTWEYVEAAPKDLLSAVREQGLEGIIGKQKDTHYQPGSPWENGYCESFNGKLRDECLNGEIFYSLKEAQIVIEKWRIEYNTKRPHSALGYRPPAPAACSPWEVNPSSQLMTVI